jgi:hypothetical protein
MSTDTPIATPPALGPVTVQAGGSHPVQVTGLHVSAHLAVTPSLRCWYGTGGVRSDTFDGLWSVTHVPTGRYVPGGPARVQSACLVHALDFARRLAAADVDWSAELVVLRVDPGLPGVCARAGSDFAACTHPGSDFAACTHPASCTNTTDDTTDDALSIG